MLKNSCLKFQNLQRNFGSRFWNQICIKIGLLLYFWPARCSSYVTSIPVEHSGSGGRCRCLSGSHYFSSVVVCLIVCFFCFVLVVFLACSLLVICYIHLSWTRWVLWKVSLSLSSVSHYVLSVVLCLIVCFVLFCVCCIFGLLVARHLWHASQLNTVGLVEGVAIS